MSSGIGRELLGAARDAVQEVVWKQTDREVSRIQIMDFVYDQQIAGSAKK